VLLKDTLENARSVAIKHNDRALMRRIEVLEKSIKAKNKDVPDYLNGETREID